MKMGIVVKMGDRLSMVLPKVARNVQMVWQFRPRMIPAVQ